MKKIDFQEPTHQLSEVMFDVKLQDVFSTDAPEKLFQKVSFTKNYKAVVNQQTHEILGIVGKNYKLIPNKDALEMGKGIFHQMYPCVRADEFKAYKVVSPVSKASAHIDLIHKDVNFNYWDQETWLPFLRVSNSYNRTYALTFEIGFVRELCSNGVIFNKDTMKLKYLHNSNKINNYKNDSSLIKEQSILFGNQIRALKDFEIHKNEMFPLVCQILNVKLDISNDKNSKRRIDQLYKTFKIYQSLKKDYTEELGTNAYAAFNIATDLISHQDTYKTMNGYYMSVRSHYSKPAIWMDDFIKRVIINPDKFSEYLSGVRIGLDKISAETGINWYIN